MVFNAAGGSRPGEHAVYPGTFDPVTPGHLDIIERARHLFARVTVLVAVNGDKQPASAPSQRALQVRRVLPADWANVSVAAWAGLTVAFCQRNGAGVLIRGVRNRSDLRHECQLAAMNEAMGVTTLPARAAWAGGHVVDAPARARPLTRWFARLSIRQRPLTRLPANDIRAVPVWFACRLLTVSIAAV